MAIRRAVTAAEKSVVKDWHFLVKSSVSGLQSKFLAMCHIFAHAQKTPSANRLLVHRKVDRYRHRICHWWETADYVGEDESANKKGRFIGLKLKQEAARSKHDTQFATADRNSVDWLLLIATKTVPRLRIAVYIWMAQNTCRTPWCIPPTWCEDAFLVAIKSSVVSLRAWLMAQTECHVNSHSQVSFASLDLLIELTRSSLAIVIDDVLGHAWNRPKVSD